MQASELKLLLTKTDLFAISPTPVQMEIPHGHLPERRRAYHPGSGMTCPIGLVKAKVIENNATWTEVKTFGCTDKASWHEVERTSGVLVEFTSDNIDPKRVKQIRHMDVVKTVEGEGESKTVYTIRMVVAKKAIIMPWSDYKPINDAREKKYREGQKRQERLTAAMREVGARYGRWKERYAEKNGSRDYDTVIYDEKEAVVEMPLLVAEQIAELRKIYEADGKDGSGAVEIAKKVAEMFTLIDKFNENADKQKEKENA